MRRAVFLFACVAMCLCMTSAPLLASDVVCQPVNARFEPSVYFAAPDCMFNGKSYANCLKSRMVGTINGHFWFYFPDSNTVTVPAPMDGHPGYMTGYGIGRFVTRHGEIWSRDSWTIDLERTVGFTAFAQVSFITGGTRKYDGATGDVFQFGSDIAGGKVRGQVCLTK